MALKPGPGHAGGLHDRSQFWAELQTKALLCGRLVSHIHEPHIGDGRSGKWRDLPAPEQAELTRIFAPFLDRFRYPQ